MSQLPVAALRAKIDATMYAPEMEAVAALRDSAALTNDDRTRIAAKGADLVRQIRGSAEPGLMEVFLAEYGLSTDEGIAPRLCCAYQTPKPSTR